MKALQNTLLRTFPGSFIFCSFFPIFLFRTLVLSCIPNCPISASLIPVTLHRYLARVIHNRDVVNYLQTMDIIQNKSSSTFMRDKFHHEIFSPQDSIDQYIGRILSSQDRLANTSQKLSDEDIITKLLAGLPATYHIVKEIIFNQPGRTITSVIAALRRHAEITQPDLAATSTGNAGGTTTSRGLYSNSGQGGRGRFRKFGQHRNSGTGIKRTESDICSKKGYPQRNCHWKQKVMKYRKKWPSRNPCGSQYGRTTAAPQVSTSYSNIQRQS